MYTYVIWYSVDEIEIYRWFFATLFLKWLYFTYLNLTHFFYFAFSYIGSKYVGSMYSESKIIPDLKNLNLGESKGG